MFWIGAAATAVVATSVVVGTAYLVNKYVRNKKKLKGEDIKLDVIEPTDGQPVQRMQSMDKEEKSDV